MDRCRCGNLVDTDADPDCYLVAFESFGLPAHKQDLICTCERCREEMSVLELEMRIPS